MTGVKSIFDTIIETCMEEVPIDGVIVEYYAVKIPYGYYFMHSVESQEIYDWCNNSFTDDRWYMRGSGTYLFKNEEDRNWFLLRWSS